MAAVYRHSLIVRHGFLPWKSRARLDSANLFQVPLHVKAQELEALASVQRARKIVRKNDPVQVESVELQRQLGQDES